MKALDLAEILMRAATVDFYKTGKKLKTSFPAAEMQRRQEDDIELAPGMVVALASKLIISSDQKGEG
jgi:hypothetical protein